MLVGDRFLPSACVRAPVSIGQEQRSMRTHTAEHDREVLAKVSEDANTMIVLERQFVRCKLFSKSQHM